MSKFKNMPGVGWFVVGIAVAVLAIPTTVGAVAALKYTGITGPSANRADVTSAGQLQVAEASPAAMIQSPSTMLSVLSSGIFTAVYSPPVSSAAILTVIHVGTSNGMVNFTFEIRAGSTCAGAQLGTYNFSASATQTSSSDAILNPGLPLPAGDSLCAIANTAYGFASVSGYTVPASAIPAVG